MKINIAVTALSLIGTRAVEVPNWKVFWCHRFYAPRAVIKFLDLESGRLFELGAYSRLGAY